MASKKIKKDVLVEKENKRDKTVAVDDVSIVEVLDSHDKNADGFKNDIVESSTVEETKIEKKKRFWDEVKSFFILVIIIGLVILVGYLFIKYAKPIEWKKNDENKDEIIIKDNEKYNVLSYVSEVKDSSLKLINNKYLVEYSGKNITKIMDIDLNILYESDEDEKYIVSEGVDGKFYAYTNSDLEEGLVLNLYVLENEKLVEVKEFAKTGVYYVPLYTDNYLVGIVGNNCYLNEDLVSVCDTSLFTLDEKERTLSNLYIEGDLKLGTGKEAPIYTRSSKYVVFKDITLGKYGLYDLIKDEIIIKPSYDDLYTTYNSSYVATKDGKTGIIDKKLKKLVDFSYDFIDINKDYYIVSKDNKLALLDSNYQLFTGFDFNYYNYTDNSINGGYNSRDSLVNNNSFASLKLNDKYILVNNIKNQIGYTYIADNVYLIENNKLLKELSVNSFGVEDLLYSYSIDTGKLIIYDESLNEKNVIDLSDYDYNKYPTIGLINGNTVIITMDSDIYYDFETGNEVDDIQDVSYNVNDLVLNYKHKDGKVVVLDDGEEVVSYSYDPLLHKKPYNIIDDNSFYYLNHNSFVLIEKR